jgi:superfamily I DNA and RNA helicase
LIDSLSSDVSITGQLFIGYPIIGTPDGRHAVDAMLVSEKLGLVLFDLVEGTDPKDFDARQDDAYNFMRARLNTYRELFDRRELKINLVTITFAPGVADPSLFEKAGYALVNTKSAASHLKSLIWEKSDPAVFNVAISAIQTISSIRKSRSKRLVSSENSRGARLKKLEDSIATLDNLQSRAVIETVNGVQRIRGLAGSGKTIVLALKAAYLHAQHPDWKIAVTFNTRSLKAQFKRLINSFFVEQTGEEPDWENLRILNAWGAPGGAERDGLYHLFCRSHGIEYFDFGTAKFKFGKDSEFRGVCESAISQAKERKKLFDAILIDEAQDFPPAFLRLCLSMLDEYDRLVYAYDELQNLSTESVLAPEQLFGTNTNGKPRIVFRPATKNEPRQDIILEKCYRNSLPVLVAAHALGFGIYRQPAPQARTGIVQMFEHVQLWEEIGYRVSGGTLADGMRVVLERTEESSPKFLEEHSRIEDLISFKQFDTEEAQANWLVAEIKNNLEKDELRHDDIIVINPDPLSTRSKVSPIRAKLLDIGIQSHLAGVDTNPDVFFQNDKNSVTFTGIYRAKGNEAGMVYIINAHDCHSSWNLARIRNRLFTAITRSKAWVRVLGIGDGMAHLIGEYSKLREKEYKLDFIYPTKAEREHMQVVHRDMSEEDRRLLSSREQNLARLIADIESGNVYLEDLDPKLTRRLQELLGKQKRI